MEQQSGIKGIAEVKPTSIDDLAALNAVIRLMAPTKGAEAPISKFARFKANPQLWYDEMDEWGVSKQGQKVLERIVKITYGMCIQQEQFMMLVQQPELGGFSLLYADKLRKSIAKKKPKDFEELEQEFFKVTKEKGCEKALCEYTWQCLVLPNKGYGFNAAHTLAYSLVALQEMNLAYNYPIIFWNTANLIVDSGAMNLEEEIYNEEKEDEEEKLKNSSTNYGKIASAIGKMKAKGLKFSLPDINKSSVTFTPLVDKNEILYGLRGITRIGNQLIKDIISYRPYNDIKDFLNKIKVNKLQMTALIKSGCFDNYYKSREAAMDKYLSMTADTKQKITVQNMLMLIKQRLIPEELDYERRLFNFNRYIKKFPEGTGYRLDKTAMNFFTNNYDTDLLKDVKINGESCSAKLEKKIWEPIYKKGMDPVRKWMKENQEEILDALNNKILQEEREKYALGTLSKWEMDSLSFYYHDHELKNLNKKLYQIENYGDIKEEDIERTFTTKEGNLIPIYRVHRIAGTVIDKNKDKGLLTLLTPTEVVTVKIWKDQFNKWDKQIFKKNLDGSKTVLEKSWFTRGEKLIIAGVKKENSFILKKYKNTSYPLIEKIIDMNEQGLILESVSERIEEEE